MKTGMVRALLMTLATGFLASGCMERPTLIPNPDPNLRKTSAQFAADAAKKHPYKNDAPRGEKMTARSQVEYTLNVIDVVNLSNSPWNDVEVWVNENYVISVKEMKPHELKRLHFSMIFDDAGNYFPVDNSKILVKKVEVRVDGKLYDVPCKIAD